MQKLRTLSIIPARSGSKSIMDKNIADIDGIPLLVFSINLAKKINTDMVIVSTDSKRYADISLKYGADVPFLRPANISHDHSEDIDFMKHAINWFQNERKISFDYIIHLRPTTPIRKVEVVNKAISFMEDAKWKSLRSAHKAQETPLKWFSKSSNGYVKPFFDVKLKDLNKPRQDFNDAYIPNGYVDIVRTNSIINENKIHDKNVCLYETDQVLEVDTIFDLEILRSYCVFKKITKYL